MAKLNLVLKRAHRSAGELYGPGTVIGTVDVVIPAYDAERVSTILDAGLVKAIPVTSEQTSPRAASAAARVLADDESSTDAKSAAGSALTQSTGRGRRRE